MNAVETCKCSSVVDSYQDGYDQYVKTVSDILHDPNLKLDERVKNALRQSIEMLNKDHIRLNDLEFYEHKFTKVSPLDLEMSGIRHCWIGRCQCGHLLMSDKDRVCPKCSQFILWPQES